MCFLGVDKSNVPWSGIFYLFIFKRFILAWVQTLSGLSPDSGRNSVRQVTKGLGLEGGLSMVSVWCCHVETSFKPSHHGLTLRLHVLIQFTSLWKLPGWNYRSIMKGLVWVTDGGQWILKFGWQHLGKASPEQSLCCCTPGDNWEKYQQFIHWIIGNIWLQIKFFLESLHFTWAFYSIKWPGHYQLMPLFALLLP